MDDTLSIKALSVATLDAANYPGTARSFPRVASQDANLEMRRSLHVDSLSPCEISIRHKRSNTGVRTVDYNMTQVLARKDALQNVLSLDSSRFKTEFVIHPNWTQAEVLTMFELHVGGLVQNAAAIVGQLFNGEK